MPNVSRKGDMIVTGHGCEVMAPIDWAPCGGSETVFANTIGVSHRGACIHCHLWPAGDDCVLHCPVVNQGSPNVFVEGIPLARVFDSADRGYIIEGSPNVFANGFTDIDEPPGEEDDENADPEGSIPDAGDGGGLPLSMELVLAIYGPDQSGLSYGTRWNPHNPSHILQLAERIKQNAVNLNAMSDGSYPLKSDADYVIEAREDVLQYGIARRELDSNGNPI